jgi:DSBA-like thioredoxin domain
MTASAHTTVVDFWFDPVCPYSWTASRWLHEVAPYRPLRVRHHVMSLYLLNEHRTDVSADYRRTLEASRGPARVATAAATRFGGEVLEAFYTAFGELVFDHWRRPSSAEYHTAIRAALPRAGLPGDLEEAMESDEHDETLQRSHETGIRPVGGEVGTPITRIDGVSVYGPVLNAIPRGADAVRVFDGTRLLVGYPQFFELKRTRTRPPALT